MEYMLTNGGGAGGGRRTASADIRENRLVIRKAGREMERERRKLQDSEKTLIFEIRRHAQKGQATAARSRTRDLVRQRKQVQSMLKFESQMHTLEGKIMNMQTTQKMAEVMKKVTTVMERINKGQDVASLSKTLMSLDRQTQMMDAKMEAIEEALDESNEEEEQETDDIINQVMDEIGINVQIMLSVPGSTGVLRDTTVPNPEDLILQNRLVALKAGSPGSGNE